ncbi:MAG: hypothetical protein JSS89_00710 [Bacteroidetes bacterium]|nr:hypothetical protein [Bacteroidota bacterium]
MNTTPRLLAALTLILVACASVRATDTLRVCTYNVLAYSASNEDGRIPNYRIVLQAIDPDLLICQEVEDATMGPRFVNEVLTLRPFAASPFIDGPDSDNQLFYDQTKFTFIGQRIITTELRNIAEFTVATIPAGDLPADTLVIYSMHLKATSDANSTAQRGREIARLQASVTTQRYVLLGGDLNLYGTSEIGYQSIVNPTTGRKFIDPLGNSWLRNSTQWLSIYTQCPRITQIAACGGGVDGGLDDRFDFLFASEELAPRIIPGSVTPFGNDGQDRRAASITVPTNTKVSKEIADALLCAADHLPVYTDIILGSTPASVNDARSMESGLQAGRTYRVLNVQGQIVLTHTASVDGEVLSTLSLPNGFYMVTDGSRYMPLVK